MHHYAARSTDIFKLRSETYLRRAPSRSLLITVAMPTNKQRLSTEGAAMKYRTLLAWMALVVCIGMGFVLGRISSLEPEHMALFAAPAAGTTATDGAQAFLPLVHAADEASPQLAATVTALVGENAQQATQIADMNSIIRYVLTKVPAQDRVPTIEVLVYQRAQLSTEVAELYIALGSPVPTSLPTPTFGPSPLPTRTPYVPLARPTPTP
jgi:hypothetical protein